MSLETKDTPQSSTEDPPYSIYTSREKWFIVFLVAFAGLFSPLTANIYLPAIPVLTKAFHESTESINLTVTVYMILQGLSPMCFGTLGDQIGRRPVFCVCLLILSLSCVGLALVPTSAYWLLVVLRCVQAAGSASTIALGAGVIGDISTPAQRGGYFGVYTIGPNLGPALGPVIGGLLSDGLGWRAIFWFLCIASTVCLLILVLFLPETLRALVGNGSITPSKIHRPLIPIVGRSNHEWPGSTTRSPKQPFRNPLLLLKHWDVVLLLIVNGVANSLYYGVIASIATLFNESYPSLSQTEIGLCYLATSGGMMLGTLAIGRLLNVEYRRAFRAHAIARGQDTEKLDVRTGHGIADDFPIEKARLRLVPYLMLFMTVCSCAYGWCVQKKVNLAGPLILQAALGFGAMAIMSATQTLIIDWVPGQGSAVTACNNLFRCLMAAGLVALMDVILDAIQPGWTYVLLGGISLVTIPIFYVVIKIGPARRRKRREEAEATIT